MGETDSLFQITVFVLIGAAWMVKEILEARRQKKRARRRPPAGDTSEAPEVIVHPHPTRRRPAPPTHAPRTTLQPHELGAVAERHLVGGRRLLRSSHAAAAHGAVVLAQRRASAYRRLSGGSNIAPGRDLTRAGILWSEILGPCRALTGPHRPPHARRTPRG